MSVTHVPSSPRWPLIGMMTALGIYVLVLGLFVSLHKPVEAKGTAAPRISHVSASGVYSLQGTRTTLLDGKRGALLLLMAPWCKYCAYEDAYVIPRLAHLSGITFDVVDVSNRGGFANPGPVNPAFSGHDQIGSPLSLRGRERVMRRYRTRFGLMGPDEQVVVANPRQWPVTSYPTWVFVSSRGQILRVLPGAVTKPQMDSLLKEILKM